MAALIQTILEGPQANDQQRQVFDAIQEFLAEGTAIGVCCLRPVLTLFDDGEDRGPRSIYARSDRRRRSTGNYQLRTFLFR